jgi:hypothetical protein
MTIPEAYGGYGFSSSAYCRVTEEIGRTDASLGILIGGHQSIGMKGLVLFGTEEQKRKWLPRLAAGEMIAAFALTEPGAGSDAAAIQTTAVYDRRPNASYSTAASTGSRTAASPSSSRSSRKTSGCPRRTSTAASRVAVTGISAASFRARKSTSWA